MISVYILKSEKDNAHYVGQTKNMERRLLKHNRGEVRSTRHRTPLKFIISVTCKTRADALKVERYLKSLKSQKAVINWMNSPLGPLAQPRRHALFEQKASKRAGGVEGPRHRK